MICDNRGMPDSSSVTHWTVILGTAAGDRAQGEKFARRYRPAVVAYLGARWRRSGLQQEVDDATQEVFVDLLRQNGALQRVDPNRPGGFRAFLFGVVRNVALRHEQRVAKRKPGIPTGFEAPATDEELSTIFDRAWASALMTQAAELQAMRARVKSDAARRRVELLHLRFEHGLKTRDIAERWKVTAKHVQKQYDKARDEFRQALLDVVATHYPGDREAAAREAARLVEFFNK